MKKSLDLLLLVHNLNPEDLVYRFKIRQPLFFSSKNIFISGIDVYIELNNTDETGKIINIIRCVCGIAGAFKLRDEKLDDTTKENIVRIQFPALLLPFVRSAVSNLFANAGFGSFIFPLFNIHEVAKQSIGELEIKVLD
jgi:preprotein translocase subunit SecB